MNGKDYEFQKDSSSLDQSITNLSSGDNEWLYKILKINSDSYTFREKCNAEILSGQLEVQWLKTTTDLCTAKATQMKSVRKLVFLDNLPSLFRAEYGEL